MKKMRSSHLGLLSLTSRFFKKLQKNIAKHKLYSLAISIFFLAGFFGILLFLNKDTPQKNSNSSAQTNQKNITQNSRNNFSTSPLTGQMLSDKSLIDHQVTAVMIDNSLSARPQSGLSQAGIIFEALTEGGVTRFMALYQESAPNLIGPIRSARPYFLDYANPFDASLAHVGGSPQALLDIKSLKMKDLDQLNNASAYQRAGNRTAPSNVFSSFTSLDEYNKKQNYLKSSFQGFSHKSDVSQTPTAGTIDFLLSSQFYNSEFKYSASTNSYLRFQGGAKQIDALNGQQLSPKVVISMFVSQAYDPDGQHTSYSTTGQGKLYVFQDGIMSPGTWRKNDRKSQLEFTDQYGLPMKLNSGQLWITLVSNDGDVTFKP